MSDGMCKTGTGGKGKGDRAPSEMVITRPYADVDSSYTIQDDINTYEVSSWLAVVWMGAMTTHVCETICSYRISVFCVNPEMTV